MDPAEDGEKTEASSEQVAAVAEPAEEEDKPEVGHLPEADEIIETPTGEVDNDNDENENDNLNENDNDRDTDDLDDPDGDGEEEATGGVSAFGMSAASGSAQASRRGLPKLREILRRQKQDSDDEDTPDIEYIYEDEDNLASEIAELYSYTEGPEFQLCQRAFEDMTAVFDLPNTWSAMNQDQKVTQTKNGEKT